MEKYSDLVDRCFEENSPEAIDNSSADHASILIEKMFQHGQETIHIFTGCLNDKVYGRPELIEKAKNYLARGGELGIIIHNPLKLEQIEQKKFIKEIKGSAADDKQVKVHQLNDEEVRKEIGIHFSVMDGKALRVETDLERKVAAAAANSPEAKRYENIYATLLKISQPLTITGFSGGIV